MAELRKSSALSFCGYNSDPNHFSTCVCIIKVTFYVYTHAQIAGRMPDSSYCSKILSKMLNGKNIIATVGVIG